MSHTVQEITAIIIGKYNKEENIRTKWNVTYFLSLYLIVYQKAKSNSNFPQVMQRMSQNYDFKS